MHLNQNVLSAICELICVLIKGIPNNLLNDLPYEPFGETHPFPVNGAFSLS